MNYYGNDPAPVSIEPVGEDVTDSLEVIQSEGDAGQNDQDFGDGLKAIRGLKI